MDGTQCLCTHLTSFSGGKVVAPNTIDWSVISLDNLFSNPVAFAVVMSLSCGGDIIHFSLLCLADTCEETR